MQRSDDTSDRLLKEASAIDGATPFQALRHVTIPLLSSSFKFLSKLPLLCCCDDLSFEFKKDVLEYSLELDSTVERINVEASVADRTASLTGTGEKLNALEDFYPERMADRILGMGDVLTLIEKAQSEIDEEAAAQMAQKMKKNQFDFEDFLVSVQQMKKMGGLGSIMNMMPGMGGMGMGKMKGLDDEQTAEAEKKMARMEAMIYSMTPAERRDPDLLNPSRKHRIAKGAGVDISEVNRMVKQFKEMKKLMKTPKERTLRMRKALKKISLPLNLYYLIRLFLITKLVTVVIPNTIATTAATITVIPTPLDATSTTFTIFLLLNIKPVGGVNVIVSVAAVSGSNAAVSNSGLPLLGSDFLDL